VKNRRTLGGPFLYDWQYILQILCKFIESGIHEYLNLSVIIFGNSYKRIEGFLNLMINIYYFGHKI